MAKEPLKLTSISVALGRTINMGNYESARLETGATASVDCDVNSPEYRKAVKLLTKYVDKQLDSIQEQLGVTPPEN